MTRSRNRTAICWSLAALLGVARAAAAAPPSNLLINPDFDSSAEGWTLLDQGVRAGDDADGCNASGAAWVHGIWVGPIIPARTLVSQCVPLPAGSSVARFRAKVFLGSAVRARILYTILGGPDCTGEILPDTQPVKEVPIGAEWTEIELALPALSGASAAVSFLAESDEGEILVLYDRMFFGSADVIFSEDFEIGEPCRWSARSSG